MSRGYRHGYTIEGTMVVSGDMDLTVLLRADGEVIGPPPGHRRNGEGHISSVCAEVAGLSVVAGLSATEGHLEVREVVFLDAVI